MSEQRGYVMGHADHERRRHSLEAAVFNPLTNSILRRAGISAGASMETLGIATAAEVNVETLEARLREEALELRGTAIVNPTIGAFARKPF